MAKKAEWEYMIKPIKQNNHKTKNARYLMGVGWSELWPILLVK